ncbi:cupin domain-containing protein [Aurantimonas sp. VKM B-3413]|uniref:cupin domain-containing protein n=1 Tax=Aurantimonas sp. VKM B-3413 TaxID=2779401 RepID=UPI001E34E19C|nr:cupin domain-containing protein [Aurantimonas sp. VKM B-3413]MCB8839320.1 cupin domain-containing protein [Aurantimonas sp. VKM B-3413]
MSERTDGATGDWVEIDAHTRRRILAHAPAMMVVEVEFKPGGAGAEHAHPHLQSSYVKSGTFSYTIAGEARTIREGDAVVVPANARHSTTTETGGSLIDVFTPAREDFLPA